MGIRLGDVTDSARWTVGAPRKVAKQRWNLSVDAKETKLPAQKAKWAIMTMI